MKFPFFCWRCETSGHVETQSESNKINIRGEIFFEPICPKCSAKLSAPGGLWERGADGVMHRQGDFDEHMVAQTIIHGDTKIQ